MIILAGILNILIPLITLILVVVAILLVLICLMQRPKNEGLGAAFGGGMTDQMFGAQTTNVLEKATVWLGIIFFTSTLALAILQTRNNTASGINTGATTEEVEGADLSLAEQLDKAETEQEEAPSLTDQLKEATETTESSATEAPAEEAPKESTVEKLKEQTEGAVDSAIENVKESTEKAGDVINKAVEPVKESAIEIKDKAGDVVKAATENTVEGASKATETIKETGSDLIEATEIKDAVAPTE